MKPMALTVSLAACLLTSVVFAGGITLAGGANVVTAVSVDGVEYPVGTTIMAESYPTQFVVRATLASGYQLYYATWDSAHGGRTVPPSLDGSFMLMPPPGTDDVATVTIYAYTNFKWADAKVAEDAFQDGSFEHPYRVLQDAVDAMAALGKNYNMVLAKSGVYDVGGSAKTSQLLASRISIPEKTCFILRAVDGPESTFIVGEKDPEGTDEGKEGWGENAVRCVMASATSYSCIQGFTLTGGATAGHNPSQAGYKSGSAVYHSVQNVSDYEKCQIADCIMSNCCGNAGVTYGSTLLRCKFLGNCTRAGLVNSCNAASCVFADNEQIATSTKFNYLNVGWMYNTTFVDNVLEDSAISDAAVYNSIIVGSETSTAATGANNWISEFGETSKVDASAFTNAPPRFLDQTLGDYHLSTVSPCLDSIPAPTDANWGATYYQYATADVDGNRLRVAADGKLTAGAYQSGVAEGYPGYLYVDPVNGDDENTGYSTNTAMRTLICALTNRNTRTGSIVYAMPGTYNTGVMDEDPSAVTTLNRVIVPEGVSLVSTGGRDVTFIVGESAPEEMQYKAREAYGCGTNAVRCVMLLTGASISGFTLTNGHTCVYYTTEWNGDHGGGVMVTDNTCLVVDCDIVDCRACRGGGLRLARATAANCRFLGNISLGLGQAVIGAGRLVNCLFDNCPNGEAAFDSGGGDATVVNCTFGPSCNNSIRDSKTGHGINAYNSIFMSKPKMGVNYHRCLFATGNEPPASATVDEDCMTNNIPAAAIGYCQGGGHRKIGDLSPMSYAIGKASEAYYDDNLPSWYPGAFDVYGRPRRNGALDLGCSEFWPSQVGSLIIVR